MRFTLALLIAVFILASVTLAKTEYEKKCTKQPLKCKKISVCLKAENKCVEHRTTPTKTCVKYKEVKKHTKVAYCKKYAEPVKDKCGNKPAGPKVCLKTGFKDHTTITKKCVKRGVITYCHKHKSVCLKKKTKKVCQKIVNKPKITGPTYCKPGEFMKFVIRNNHTERVCSKIIPKKITYKTCQVYNDPHFIDFKGRRFNYHVEGDYNIAETADGVFKVHATLKRLDHNAWTGIIGAAVLVNGKDIIEIKNREVYLNKKKWAVPSNQIQYIPRGGSILVTGSDITIVGPNQSKVQFPFSFSGLININVFLDEDDNSNGLCVEFNDETKRPVSGLMRKVTYARVVPEAYFIKEFENEIEKMNAVIECRAAGARNKDVETCVSDMAQASNPRHKVMVLDTYRNRREHLRRARYIVLPFGHHIYRGFVSK
ncbi:hypothetical protein AKO1_003500 [Acrasis kona]|uniref:VWFD domain-containing protein n=1 Tax=Acrasis kona TaxID=1008807 RepID=A0AAW2YGS2_9EUKA